ncbi:hypothetical protein [Streptomyces drozdowiczii]|uniref:Lipoprotein n=1 Tax=Streptomyces drozdowiczii TaxID=202862 RepID=A0ABY6PQT9_9ACTN|nr:hypothetical protein [Streptomyces drozdowiczii]MCX0245816.1 hypothetical protein [Streptomyces drozdowiczii]UZK54592.1 hypothetical protein NEH16_10960 [Streptomyces drozdowiczii]
MKRTRAVTTAAVMMAAGLLVGGCTSTPHDGAADEPAPAGSSKAAADKTVAREQRACRGGTYTWFNLRDQSVLNGLAAPQRIPGKSHTMVKLTEPVRRLRTDQASLDFQGPRPDQREVLFALSVRLGFAEKDEDPEAGSGLAEPGQYAEIDSGGGEVGASGRTLRLAYFSFVRLVETDFRYTCGSGGGRRATTGHVVTWGSSGGGLISCEEPLDRTASAAAHEAFRLSCPA